MKKQELYEKTTIKNNEIVLEELARFHNICADGLEKIYDIMNKISDKGHYTVLINLDGTSLSNSTNVMTNIASSFSGNLNKFNDVPVNDIAYVYFPKLLEDEVKRFYGIMKYDLYLNGYSVTDYYYPLNNYKDIAFIISWGGDEDEIVKTIPWYNKFKNFIAEWF
jgi:hypothetical protein